MNTFKITENTNLKQSCHHNLSYFLKTFSFSVSKLNSLVREATEFEFKASLTLSINELFPLMLIFRERK